MINEKTIVSTISLVASLATYFYAKETQKDVVPYVMIGGFIGAIFGEVVAGVILSEDKNKNDKQDKSQNPKKE
jgi:predicted Na+-dependent transporter